MNLLYDPNKGDFGLELSLSPHMENSSNAFEAMASLIRALEGIDRDLARSIDPDLDSHLVLQELEIGSLRTWFAMSLRNVPDDLIKEGNWNKVIGHFLVKAKYIVLRWLEGKETITEYDEIQRLRAEITKLRNEVDQLRQFPVEAEVPMIVVVAAVKRVTDATKLLPPGQKMSFASPEGTLEINRSFSITDEQIQQILTRKSATERAFIPLIIKRPDYLGTSMWDMIIKGRAVKAKIVDKEWLERFHSRDIHLLPGDALMSDVRIDCHLDENGEEIEQKYTVERVKEVSKIDREQLDLLTGNAPDASSSQIADGDGKQSISEIK